MAGAECDTLWYTCAAGFAVRLQLPKAGTSLGCPDGWPHQTWLPQAHTLFLRALRPGHQIAVLHTATDALHQPARLTQVEVSAAAESTQNGPRSEFQTALQPATQPVLSQVGPDRGRRFCADMRFTPWPSKKPAEASGALDTEEGTLPPLRVQPACIPPSMSQPCTPDVLNASCCHATS